MRTLRVTTEDGPVAFNPAHVVMIFEDEIGVWVQASESEPICVKYPPFIALCEAWDALLRCA